MKTNKFITALLSLLLLAATAISLSSCNKDDDPKESENNNVNNNDTPSGQNAADSLVGYYNDLEFFQDYFIATDSLGNFLYRTMGVPLYESDTAHLYIGVDNIDEALQYFEYAIAPDIAKQTSVSNNYTYTLTDTSGNSLGTVSFVPGGGSSVAEITTNLPGLKYFNKVTFLQNSAWPYNSDEVQKKWKLGDVRTLSIVGRFLDIDYSDRVHQWLLVREGGHGKSPIWVSSSALEYSFEYIGWGVLSLQASMYCPEEAQALEIANLINKMGRLDFFRTYSYWFNKKDVGYTYYSVILVHAVIQWDIWGTREVEINKRPRLLKIDWIDEVSGDFYTLMGTSDGKYSSESASNLFDGNTQTKWCSNKKNKVDSEINHEGCWIVEFMSEKPINPTAYYMVTGNDQKVFPGRNPKIWNIYAKKNPGDNWVLIDKRDNTDYNRDRMENENFWTGWWGVNVGKEKYQYFRLEMYENWGDDCFQISEFGFQYNENVVTDENEITYSVIDASDGEPGNLAPCLFDGNLDTKWCVYKDNKSKTPLHDGKCWYVEFKASKSITPAGFYMTTASDQTVFPGRAPRKWNIYGLKDGWWTLIASYDNTDTPMYQMTNLDKWTGNWGINVAPGEYQYFRLEMYENWGGDCFQISEFGFNL